MQQLQHTIFFLENEALSAQLLSTRTISIHRETKARDGTRKRLRNSETASRGNRSSSAPYPRACTIIPVQYSSAPYPRACTIIPVQHSSARYPRARTIIPVQYASARYPRACTITPVYYYSGVGHPCRLSVLDSGYCLLSTPYQVVFSL